MEILNIIGGVVVFVAIVLVIGKIAGLIKVSITIDKF